VEQICTDTSSCSGGECDASTSTSESSIAGSACDNDANCGSDAPRCLNKTCVDAQTGDLWLCAASDKPQRPNNVRYNFHVIDFLGRPPPPNIVAKACRNNDVACAEPVARYEDTAQTGSVEFMLPSGFMGYFEVKSDAIDTVLYVTKPIFKNTLDRDLPVLTVDTVDLLASLVGSPYDPEKGLALLEALGCEDAPQGGIHFNSREGGEPFYLVDQIPDTSTQVTVYDAVNNSANGGFINVPTGFVQFSASVGVDGLQLGSFNAQIRPRTITFIDMHP
jgi:hypothetical protein